MKIYRSILCLVVALLSILHCGCESSEEHGLANELRYMEPDRAKPPLEGWNGLLESLAHAKNSDEGDSTAPGDYEAAESIAGRLGYAGPNTDNKRSSWGKMNAAWGKRANHGGRNSGWTRFGGAWGKREPSWNNLKGLWGKRAGKWDKLSAAWGKRQQAASVQQ